MQRTLITGIGGFAGRHLAARLRRCDQFQIYGLGTAATTATLCDGYFPCDLTDAVAVDRVVDEVRPDLVFHLAARTAAASYEQLYDVNVRGFTNLCDALRRNRRSRAATIRLLVVGSAAELGTAGTARLPIREDAPCRPESNYGNTKLAATQLALNEPTDGPLQVCVARTFNLVGPGLGQHLALGRFAAQLAACRRGELDRVRCGNPAGRRDYVDVRDAVDAYLAIARHGRPGELYNVCSGRSHAVGDLLARLITHSGLDVPVEYENGPNREADPADVYGDPTKTAEEIGWRSATPIDRSLIDMLTEAMEPVCVCP